MTRTGKYRKRRTRVSRRASAFLPGGSGLPLSCFLDLQSLLDDIREREALLGESQFGVAITACHRLEMRRSRLNDGVAGAVRD